MAAHIAALLTAGHPRTCRAQEGQHSLLWVVDFPMFEWNEEEARLEALHHPFTAPNPQDLEVRRSQCLRARRPLGRAAGPRRPAQRVRALAHALAHAMALCLLSSPMRSATAGPAQRARPGPRHGGGIARTLPLLRLCPPAPALQRDGGDLRNARALAYDMVYNGVEIGGGSLRIYRWGRLLQRWVVAGVASGRACAPG